MKTLKAGIIGLGVGEQHIAAYQNQGVEILKICDFQPEKLAEVSSRHPQLATSLSPEDVLTDPEINLVSIASWDNHHCSQILMALDQEKHVFVEKPICLYDWEAVKIRSVLNEKPHLRLSSNLILRYSPRFLDLRQRIQAGEFGQLFYIEGDYNYGRIQKLISGWRGQLPYYSIVLGGGVHLIDLMRWLSADEVVTVSAIGNQFVTAGTHFSNPDLVVALLQFKSGLIGKLAVNFGCVYPHFHPLQVYGTKASFTNHLGAAEIFFDRDPQIRPHTIATAYPGIHKGALLEGFIQSLQAEAEWEVSENEVFSTLSVCFAIEQSLKKGGTVTVDYI